MNTKDLKETKDIKEYPNSPLFTGDYRRDTSISEFEKNCRNISSNFRYDEIKKKG